MKRIGIVLFGLGFVLGVVLFIFFNPFESNNGNLDISQDGDPSSEGSSLNEGDSNGRSNSDNRYEEALGNLGKRDTNNGGSDESGGSSVDLDSLENNDEDSKGNEYLSNLQKNVVNNRKASVVKKDNVDLVVHFEDIDEFTYSDTVRDNTRGGGSLIGGGSPRGESGNGGADTSNDVKGDFTPNRYSELVEDIYDREYDLRVLPIDDTGFSVFNEDFNHVFNGEDRIFYFTPGLDDLEIVAEVVRKLGLSMSVSDIVNNIYKAGNSGDRHSVNGVTFIPGHPMAIRWK